MVRQPFTQQHWVQPAGHAFIGTTPYFAMPNPQPPSQRSAAPPPVVAPRRGAWGWRKTALPPQATAAFTAQAGGLTYGAGGGPGQGIIQSPQPIASVKPQR